MGKQDKGEKDGAGTPTIPKDVEDTSGKEKEKEKRETLDDIEKDLKRPKRSHHKKKQPIGRPPGPGKKNVVVDERPPEQVEAEQAARACGISVSQMVFTLGQALGGDEWKPTDEERNYMAYAWATYFQAKGLKDLPPGVVLATALIAYATPRLTKPKTQGKLKKAYVWILTRLKRKPREPIDRKEATAEDIGPGQKG